MSAVVCKLPDAGLGNQLFPLMHAMVFAELNHLPLFVTGYHRIKLGPYLRGEKSKRSYSGYFKFQKSLLAEWADKIRIRRLMRNTECVNEPLLQKISPEEASGRIFLFEKMTTYHDYFIHLKPYREMVKEIFFNNLNPALTKMVTTLTGPIIGVHVRMGDFRKLGTGEVFRGGHVRTPETYYVDQVLKIREIAGNCLPATVFTDGYPHEFRELLQLPGVTLAEKHADIVDLVMLIKSKLIISTTGSTFSYWAGFLSDAVFLKHPEHLHAPIRSGEALSLYEGPGDAADDFFVRQVKKINEESSHK